MPVGAIGAKFSTGAADRLAQRIRWWALALTAASVVTSAVFTALAARVIVAQPVGRLLDAVDRFRGGATAARVDVRGADPSPGPGGWRGNRPTGAGACYFTA